MAGRSRPVVGAGRAAGLGETWPVAGPVACLPCRHSASRVLRIAFGDSRERLPLTPSLRRHGGWQERAGTGLPRQTATSDRPQRRRRDNTMRTPHKNLNRPRNRYHQHVEPDVGQTIAVGIPHDRYTVAFHLDTCQMWVLDTAGRDTAHGPYLSSRQAWMIANELNITCARFGER